MYDIVEGFHKALRIESTWAFVLVVALGAGLVGGFFAWIIDAGYRNSPEYKAERSPKQGAVTSNNSTVDVTASGFSSNIQNTVATKPRSEKPNKGRKQAQQSPTIPMPQPEPPINSVVENAGNINGLRITDAEVVAPANGDATVLKTLPGSQTNAITIDNPSVISNGPGMPSYGGAGVTSTLSYDVMLEDNVICGGSTLIKADRASSNIVINNSVVGDLGRCEWGNFTLFLATNRTNFLYIMANWRATMKQKWANLPGDKKRDFNHELDEIEGRLTTAMGDADEFGKVVRELRDHPPKFVVHP